MLLWNKGIPWVFAANQFCFLPCVNPRTWLLTPGGRRGCAPRGPGAHLSRPGRPKRGPRILPRSLGIPRHLQGWAGAAAAASLRRSPGRLPRPARRWPWKTGRFGQQNRARVAGTLAPSCRPDPHTVSPSGPGDTRLRTLYSQAPPVG